MARMIRVFLLICCMIVQTLQYENEQIQYKTLHVYKSDEDSMKKPAVFTADAMEKNVSFKRQKRDSNASNDKQENNKNITTAVSENSGLFFQFHFRTDKIASIIIRNVIFLCIGNVSISAFSFHFIDVIEKY